MLERRELESFRSRAFLRLAPFLHRELESLALALPRAQVLALALELVRGLV
jgi:hypothetical protein